MSKVLKNLSLTFGESASSPKVLTIASVNNLIKAIVDPDVTTNFSGHVTSESGSIDAAQAYSLAMAGISFHGNIIPIDFNFSVNKTSIVDGDEINLITSGVPVNVIDFNIESVNINSGVITEEEVRNICQFEGSKLLVVSAGIKSDWSASVVIKAKTKYIPSSENTVTINIVHKAYSSINLSESSVNFDAVSSKTVSLTFGPASANVPIESIRASLENVSAIYEVGVSGNNILISCKSVDDLVTNKINIEATDVVGKVLTSSINISNKVLPTITIEGPDSFNAKNGTGEANYTFNISKCNVPLSLVKVTSSNSNIKVSNANINGFKLSVSGTEEDISSTITATIKVDLTDKNMMKSVTAKYIENITPFIITNTTNSKKSFTYNIYKTFYVAKMLNHIKGSEDYNDIEYDTVEAANNIAVELESNESFLIFSNEYRNTTIANFKITSFDPDFDGDILGMNKGKLGRTCFKSMFYECTSITKTPNIHISEIYQECCKDMFRGCTSLKDASNIIIDGNTAGEYSTPNGGECFYEMFSNCTSLIKAPKIILNDDIKHRMCYRMFEYCTNLSNIDFKVYSSYIAGSSFYGCFIGCTNLNNTIEFINNNPITVSSSCFELCYCETNIESATIPNIITTFASSICRNMFNGCKNLKRIEIKMTDTGLYKHYDYNHLNILAFFVDNCPNLNYVKVAFTKNDDENALLYWLYGASPTGTIVKPSSLTLPTGDNGIPSGWTVEDIIE